MGYVSTWIGGYQVEVLDSTVVEYMTILGCTYDDALFEVACDKLKLSSQKRLAIIKGE